MTLSELQAELDQLRAAGVPADATVLVDLPWATAAVTDLYRDSRLPFGTVTREHLVRLVIALESR